MAKLILGKMGYYQSKLQFTNSLNDGFDRPTKFISILDYPQLDSMLKTLGFVEIQNGLT